jgi:hypothetical protein
LSIDLTKISSTRTANRSEVERVVLSMPVGSLVRVRWLERLDVDELDPGIDLEEIDNRDPVMIVEWHKDLSFIDVNGDVVVEFTCLWRGGLYMTTSYCIDEVVRVEED